MPEGKTLIQRLIEVAVEVKQDSRSSEEIKPELITGETTLREAGLDSMDQFEFAYRVGEQFDVSIPDETAAKLETFGQYVDYLNTQKKR